MRPIHSLIDRRYLIKTEFLRSVTASIRSRLSSDVREHCWVGGIEQDYLILVTDMAERASIIRHQQHELLKQVNEEFRPKLIRPVRRLKLKIEHKTTGLKQINSNDPAQTATRAQEYHRHCADLLKIIND